MKQSALLSVLMPLCLVAAGCTLADAAALGSAGMHPAPRVGETDGSGSRVASLPGRVASVQQLRASIWIEDDRDLFRRSERVQVNFRISEPAYVAVVHIDTDGQLELLYPADRWDEGYVRGQRVYTLPSAQSQWGARWAIGARPGIGYLYLIASPEPLDLRFFEGRYDRGSQVFGSGRVIRGDPFWAMRNLADILVDSRYAPYAEDFYSYHVGERHAYPSYACYDRGYFFDDYGWDGYYRSCDRISLLLRQYPDYYDTRRYRGDRDRYRRELEQPDPRHGFKERADLPEQRFAPPVRDDRSGIGVTRTRPNPPAASGAQRPERVEQERARPVTPTRKRPTLERRPPEREPARPEAREPARPATSRPPPRGSEPRARPRVEPRQPDRRPTPSTASRPSVRRPEG